MIIPNELLFENVASMLSEGHTVTLKAKGNSMFPFIVGGRDCVVLRKHTCVEVGDIVLARLLGKCYVMHRVYRKEGNELVLMGDGNVHGTERCLEADVCGVVQEIVRDGHNISCRSERERRNAGRWKRLLPVRRYILAVWRRWRRWREKTE